MMNYELRRKKEERRTKNEEGRLQIKGFSLRMLNSSEACILRGFSWLITKGLLELEIIMIGTATQKIITYLLKR